MCARRSGEEEGGKGGGEKTKEIYIYPKIFKDSLS
jgi:hypothetical protein